MLSGIGMGVMGAPSTFFDSKLFKGKQIITENTPPKLDTTPSPISKFGMGKVLPFVIVGLVAFLVLR